MTSRKSNLGLINSKKYCDQAIKLRKSPKSPKPYRPRLPRNHRFNVSDLVYKFLADTATVNAERRQSNNARNNFQRVHVRRSNKQNRRPDDKRRTDDHISGSSMCLKSYYDRQLRTKSLPSKIKKREKGIVECFPNVEDYVETLHEYRQKAKRFIRKAITFGVNAGFLIPNDSVGHLFRVSSTLKRVRDT